MIIAVSGASGFIGSYLAKQFTEQGHKVTPLKRELFKNESENDLRSVLSSSDVVINLAGASINKRWTTSYKKEMIDSRINTTQKIVSAINSLQKKPDILISASAVGYYPSDGNCYNEYSSEHGEGFLANLVLQWENEASKISSDVRLAITRFAVVLSDKGGAYEKMIQTTKLGIASIIGNGNQPFPWVDVDDLFQAIYFIINNKSIQGVVNITSPQQTTNKQFTKLAAKYYNCLLTVKVPKFVLKLMLGEASEIVCEGQCVKPSKLLEKGFVFKVPTLDSFMNKINKKV